MAAKVLLLQVKACIEIVNNGIGISDHCCPAKKVIID